MKGLHLVTGGAGFIGRHLVAELLADPDISVLVLDNYTASKRGFPTHPRLEVVEGDIRDWSLVADLMTRTNVVHHLAANSDVQVSWEDPDESTSVNVVGTSTIMEAAARSRSVWHVNFASSSSVYGETRGFRGIKTDSPCRPVSPYGAFKMCGEGLGWTWAPQGRFSLGILRMFNVYGPGQDPARGMVVPRFIQQSLRGEAMTIQGAGSQVRDFVHVTDVARTFARSHGSTQILNVGTGKPVTIAGLTQVIGSASGLPFQVKHIEGRSGDPACVYADQPIHKEVIALGDGVKSTLDHYSNLERVGNAEMPAV